ncbi:single-strand DNA-binding protein [Paenibacillus shirakamiensis]|uniref:Single-stranded DNA-binding protein n=1 Tax=Paenibacillus shirakamiensis TaxID=1265935 RepID=A0ABS4JF19_9BACL|nr:single-stranded DNA-binding protein [Paenibacillus shirakamiensis]MBP1999726.1 single-strand DNA-binding protein [Paenibacillus shirakamiensis]
MLNRVILIGRLTRDPELRYSGSGTAVTKFTVACDRRGDDGADFIQVVTFKQTAEACASYLKKGRLVGIEGRWQTGNFENNEGKKVYTNDCIADNVRFLEKSNSGQASSGQSTTNKDPFQDDGKPIDISNDDMPF